MVELTVEIKVELIRMGTQRDGMAIHRVPPNVRFWHLADIPNATTNVRFGGKADMASAKAV